MLSTAFIVLIVLLFLTKPLQYMPNCVLATVVFIIGVELVDIAGMRKIFGVRRDEFVVATITAATVVLVGVEQAVILAIMFSIIDHLRRSYLPKDSVLVPTNGSHLHAVPVAPDARTLDGLVVYHFAASLYYANANHFSTEILELTAEGQPPVRWLVLDASAIADVDFSGRGRCNELAGTLQERTVRLLIAEASPDVRRELDRYGFTDLIGEDAYYATVAAALAAFSTSADPKPEGIEI